MEGRFFEIFKKIKKFSEFKNCSKSFPKVSKRVLNMIWGNFFGKSFWPVFHGGRVFENFQKKSKIFKNRKMPKIVPKSVQTCFEHVLGQFFPKKNFAQCSMDGRVFKNFQKKSKNFQKSRNAQNRSQNCPNVF